MNKTSLIIVVFISALVFGPLCLGASVSLRGPNGEAELVVKPGEEFQVVVSVQDAKELLGFDLTVVATGSISASKASASGSLFTTKQSFACVCAVPLRVVGWFPNGASVSGNGQVAVFTLKAGDQEGGGSVTMPLKDLILVGIDSKQVQIAEPSALRVVVSKDAKGHGE